MRIKFTAPGGEIHYDEVKGQEEADIAIREVRDAHPDWVAEIIDVDACIDENVRNYQNMHGYRGQRASRKEPHRSTAMKCVCCGVEVHPMQGAGGQAPPERAAWTDGAVSTFSPGFGSRWDDTTLIVAICDDCLDKKIGEGVIAEKV